MKVVQWWNCLLVNDRKVETVNREHLPNNGHSIGTCCRTKSDIDNN